MKSEITKKSAHLCLKLGESKAVRNGGSATMCLRPLLSKALREVWDIVPMGQWELAHLCIRLGQSKVVRIDDRISPMWLRQLRSKALREVQDIVPMGQW